MIVSRAVVDLECSSAAPCTGLTFRDMSVTVPSGEAPGYTCVNVASSAGLPSGGECAVFNMLEAAATGCPASFRRACAGANEALLFIHCTPLSATKMEHACGNNNPIGAQHALAEVRSRCDDGQRAFLDRDCDGWSNHKQSHIPNNVRTISGIPLYLKSICFPSRTAVDLVVPESRGGQAESSWQPKGWSRTCEEL